jgi:glycosyltransferase involved in cell wall biosynthesis
VGILRGPSLNPYEGQCLEKLPKYGFQPVGITTYDNAVNLSEIHFPVRVGHNLKTLTKGKLWPLFVVAGKVTKYNFGSWNLRVFNLKKLTADLDVIYSADMWYPYTYQAVKTGIPTIVMEWENIPKNVEALPYSKIKKYNREHATHFVAITEKAKEALIIEGVGPDRISVVPAGLDCERFKPAEKNEQVAEKLGISKDLIRILFVGRLVPEKGIFDLLNAFSILLRNVQNVELLIVGSGSSSMQIQISQLVENLKIGGKVKFLGSIEYSNMPQIHNLADVFCLPSIPTKTWAEQFGYSMVEAMACGKPVVSTSTGSIPEVVKDRATGILVKPNDPRGLESALEELILNKQERDAFGSNAREWVLQKFEANKVAGQLADIYSRFV